MEMLVLSSLIFPWPSYNCSHQSLYPCSISEATLNLCSPNCEWPLYFGSRFVPVFFNSPAHCLSVFGLWCMNVVDVVMMVGMEVMGYLSLLRHLLTPWRLLPLPQKFLNRTVLVVGHSRITPSRPPISNFTVCLNKPILSASITVIFAEEEAQSSASVHTSASLSQGGKQSGEDVGNVFNYDNVQVEKGMPEDIKQPDGTLQGILGSFDQARRPFGIRRSVAIPDGNGLKVETTAGEVYLGPSCSILEELKDHGSDV